MSNLPKTPIKTGRMTIDFRDREGLPLKYIRFEMLSRNYPAIYVGSISSTQKAKLRKLRDACNYYLNPRKKEET